MQQTDLFGVRAQCTGFTIRYEGPEVSQDEMGHLVVTPHWSKHSRADGRFDCTLDGQDQQILRDLLRAVADGFLRIDPGYAIPKRCRTVLQDYKDYSDQQTYA